MSGRAARAGQTDRPRYTPAMSATGARPPSSPPPSPPPFPPPAPRPAPWPAPTPADVAIIVLTHNGRAHLPACLTACLALDGLAEPAAVVVADNGSADGALDAVARDFPAVTRVDLGANRGFAAGNNAAARSQAAERPWLLFLNDDTAVDRRALRALCDALGPGDACAGARLVDWAGARLDFDGGAASWTGHGHPLGHGRRLATRRGHRPAGPLTSLFACGAAMLVHRATFLALGGFDADYFMYYEDVDLGWRLTLAGHDVRHVPAAVVRHRGGGSASAHPSAARARWHARNALANVVKNTAGDHLDRVVPAALALAAVRAGAPPDVIDAAARATAAAPAALPRPDDGWPGWPYLAGLDLDWANLAAARAAVQPLWRRPPDAVIARLGRPWAPVPPTRDGWAALRRAAAVFDLTAIFGPVDVHAGLRGRLWRVLGR